MEFEKCTVLSGFADPVTISTIKLVIENTISYLYTYF